MGAAEILGINLMKNFNAPYLAQTVTDFWHRWHISLSTWFRDYVYIPLGGNRVSKAKHAFNILVVWALTGLWHGAGWNFVAWGLYYGILLLAEKFVWGKALTKMPKIIQHIYALFIVVIGWIFFASPSFTHAFDYIKHMFIFTGGSCASLAGWTITFIIGIISCTPLFAAMWGTVKIKHRLTVLETALCLAGLILCVASLVTETYNPFLYFRF